LSVAFRRESDEEHLEPRFELPIPPGPNLVTPNGLTLIQSKVDELESLVAQQRPEPELEEAKRDLRYWRTRLATAQVVTEPPQDEVAFGSRVTFRRHGDVRTIEIVGHDEADPPRGRIALSAPLVQALIGGRERDVIDFAGEDEGIEILGVEPIQL
jgi:transcription elongation GreA/GreB family factor